MGLMNFDRRACRRLFEADHEAAARLEALIEADSFGVGDLEIGYRKGAVTVSGRCEHQFAKDQVVLLLGNIEGVGKVVSDELSTPPLVAGEVPAELIYEIRLGDTLAGIAEMFCGNALPQGVSGTPIGN